MFTNRGGSIGLNENNQKKHLLIVLTQLAVINTYGDLILCCQDFTINTFLGILWIENLEIFGLIKKT